MSSPRVFLRLVLCVVATLTTVGPPAAQAADGDDLSGAALAKELQAGPVSLTGVRIRGDVVLDDRVIQHGFSCRDCAFDGDLSAFQATFNGPVDLSGSTVAGNLTVAKAVFEKDLRAASTTIDGTADLRQSRIYRTTDFSLATFSGLATFESATLQRAADFTLARFEGDAIFAGGESKGRMVYERAIFSGLADFSERTFDQRVDFQSTEFRSDADFSQATVNGPVSFRAARFGSDASFFGAQFLKIDAPDQQSTFERVRAKGKLDFGLALFERPASFAQTTSSGVLSFAGADFHSVPDGINLDDISVGSVVMSVAAAATAVTDGSTHDRERVLDLIETSAQARGNLGLANQAHYKRQALRGDRYGWPLHTLDFVFYRSIAGYFVRPINPLLALLALAAAITLVRVYLRHRAVQPVPRRGWSARAVERGRTLAKRTPRIVSSFPGEFAGAIGSVVPWNREGDSPPARRLEAFLYRAIVACALIGLANSNPTLRQMFDALS